MKIRVLCLPVILGLLLAACAGIAKTPTALPTVILGNSVSTPVPNTATGAGVTASGIIVADQKAEMAFSLAGNVRLVNVAVGDQVQAGQLLVQLEDATQQIQLEQANLVLQELTSPEAIANARLAVTTAQTDVINAQAAWNNQQYWKNDALIQDYYAKFVIAKDNLDRAQDAYDKANVGEYINNAGEAGLYQALYNARQAYDTAEYYFSLYSQKPTQRQMDEAQATLDLAKAKLTNAQNYLAALTSGNIPEDASGSSLKSFRQAKLAIQSAQNNLGATRLVAPFPGEVASIMVSTGDYITPGQVILVISDVSHLHVETTDLSERDVPLVKLGQAVTVSIKALNQAVAAKITAISPLADSLGGDVVYRVTIVLDDLPSNLRAGMSVDVQFKTGQ
jgi:multidrug efflux pump subunit AcrA (membrane-fusion protein)